MATGQARDGRGIRKSKIGVVLSDRMDKTVEIVETRPLSKDKCWRVSRLIGRPEVR
jgi:ribosomal protein S17